MIAEQIQMCILDEMSMALEYHFYICSYAVITLCLSLFCLTEVLQLHFPLCVLHDSSECRLLRGRTRRYSWEVVGKV